ncbi:flagellin [Bryobacter aggregatus]|uniref:flagellin N-terminal helical domain-containing protein n=1 Tax=Bryobacter aggregatus TaxID=360054 RepID=UPI0004E20478|nr:flagellin [Bryobacter aggregatus]
MAFSANTNIASLQAQSYINNTSDFQSKTINRVTSGLRIVNSGDDAAGLAIANGLRSDQAVLTQGVRNANDGLSQLQIVDGGINNISKLLDRARTLATQSASGTFTGSRSVLNSEFKSVIEEIDRQSQAIGLNTGGSLAKSLSVFIGGGKTSSGISAISNGSVAVDLSTSTVDAKSLGLKGVQAKGISGTDIGTGSSTSVANILTNATNTGSQGAAGFTDFYFRGSGFSDDNAVKVAVNLSGVTDAATLATAVNAAIDAAGNGASQYATAFKNAGIKASVVTDSATGKQSMAFTSANTAFQVAAGDRTANALLGNFSSGTTGVDLAQSVSGAAISLTGVSVATASNIIVRIKGSGLSDPVDITLKVTGGSSTYANVVADLSSQIQNNSTLQAAGIKLGSNFAGGQTLSLTDGRGEVLTVETLGDAENALGFGTSYRQASQTTFSSNNITGSNYQTGTPGNSTIRVALSDGSNFDITANTGATIAAGVANLNAAFAANASAAKAGLYATVSGGQVQIRSQYGTDFRLDEAYSATTNFGFSSVARGAAAVGTTSTSSSLGSTSSTFNSGGAQQTALLSFSGINYANDAQTISLSATDSGGSQQNLSVVLRNDTTVKNAVTIDDAIDAINTALTQSNNDTLKKVVAVKENDGGTEKIRFLSTLSSFKVSIGSNSSGSSGITTGQGTVVTSASAAGGSTSDISTQENAQAAVTALADAVDKLGQAQAVVGRGQNQFGFAVNLAQSQLTNLAASESRIRDADLAQEAANLSKAQIQLQAGIAALAQANSAPQQVLSLLRG